VKSGFQFLHVVIIILIFTILVLNFALISDNRLVTLITSSLTFSLVLVTIFYGWPMKSLFLRIISIFVMKWI